MTSDDLTECIHGLEPMTCSYCRTALGFRPGVDRHRNDCSVVTVQNLTGATYQEALQALADAGRKPGKGVSVSILRGALASVGFRTTPVDWRLGEYVPTTGSFLVCAWRGNTGHAFSIVDGTIVDAGKFAGPGTRYQMFQVA